MIISAIMSKVIHAVIYPAHKSVGLNLKLTAT